MQSNYHHQQTKILLFTGWMTFLSVNRVKALKGKVLHSTDVLTPNLLSSLSSTTKGSRLPWGVLPSLSYVSLMTPVPSYSTELLTKFKWPRKCANHCK